MDSAEYLHRLSESPDHIRNFCMVAHVDHGKTTLSDFLVASNGILSPQLAGKVRLLDSRPDEQERLITMKASSIALHHKMEGTDYLLHLVDSPGHIDFSCEVSTAIRLCDGALVIIDLVDGVTMQTCSMLRHVYREGMSMCLVLNKIDLLITRQQMTAEEAYFRMRSVIETCNATLSAYSNQLKIASEYDSLHLQDPEDDVWFCPTKGNVVFSSCFDGWGFTLDSFAKIYEEKLGMTNLRSSLWGEHFLDVKTKTVLDVPKREGQPCMALQLVLEPIWHLHRTFLAEGELDVAAATNMSLKLGIAEKIWNRPKLDTRQKLGALMSHWLPLAKSVLDMTCKAMRSPPESHKRRLPALIPTLESAPQELQEALRNCDSSNDHGAVAFISKLIDTEYLAGQSLVHSDAGFSFENTFVGFARVYCGRLKRGQEVYVNSNGLVSKGTISCLYILRGLGLEEVPEVCSGCLCGIAGLTSLITKFATVSTRADAPPFAPLALPSTSIVRLSVHPKDPTELQQLVRGLHMLNRVDPQVEVNILPTGEHVIGTAGEVHAERCIKDLHETFARVELVVSEPLVSFRETVVATVGKPKPVTVTTADGALSITMVARPLPPAVMELIDDDAKNSNTWQLEPLVHRVTAILADEEHKKKWSDALRGGIIGWGCSKFRFVGSLLMCSIPLPVAVEGPPVLVASPTTETGTGGGEFPGAATSSHGGSSACGDIEKSKLVKHFRDAIFAGFQLAAAAGPMAEEPLFGLAFVVTDICTAVESAGGEESFLHDSASVSGGVMVAVRDACRRAMEQPGLGRRLVEPVYHCVVYSAGSTQGKIYAVLSRRRAEIQEEVPNEGSDLFYISCYLPAVEAFGLQDELRITTHGAATAQLQMHHWAIVDADPYYKPTTKDELEEHGASIASQNIAAALLEKVRRRKGIYREIVVESAEKQKFSMKGA